MIYLYWRNSLEIKNYGNFAKNDSLLKFQKFWYTSDLKNHMKNISLNIFFVQILLFETIENIHTNEMNKNTWALIAIK